MTFPNRDPDTREFFERALALFERAGIPVPVVSGGGTPAIFSVAELPDADRASRRHLRLQRRDDGRLGHGHLGQLRHAGARDGGEPADADGRAIVDCGTKVLTSDQYGMKGYGHVLEYPEAVDRAASPRSTAWWTSRRAASGRTSARSSTSCRTTAAW